MKYSESAANKMQLAPVAVFGYRRPDHLERVLRSLSNNLLASETQVYIFLDGPRETDNLESLLEVRKVAEGEYGFRSTQIISRESNLGLAKSIRSGVEFVLNLHNEIIVVEDDLVVGTGFLKFMNESLNFYLSCKKVASIHGYQYPLSEPLQTPVFLRGADCWGWGTWKDRWESVSFNTSELIKEFLDRGLVDDFNLSGNMPYFEMLNKLERGEIDSWAICWHASMFLHDSLTLFPPRSLVQNEGNDGSGIHSGTNLIFATNLSDEVNWDLPTLIEEDARFRKLMGGFYGSHFGRKLTFRRIFAKLKREYKRLINSS